MQLDYNLINEMQLKELRKGKVNEALQYILPHIRHICFMFGGLGCTNEVCDKKKTCWYPEMREFVIELSKKLELYNTLPPTEEEIIFGYKDKINEIRENYKHKKEEKKDDSKI
jgi:hypothetical protein